MADERHERYLVFIRRHLKLVKSANCVHLLQDMQSVERKTYSIQVVRQRYRQTERQTFELTDGAGIKSVTLTHRRRGVVEASVLTRRRERAF